jgi:hypothetical protein
MATPRETRPAAGTIPEVEIARRLSDLEQALEDLVVFLTGGKIGFQDDARRRPASERLVAYFDARRNGSTTTKEIR